MMLPFKECLSWHTTASVPSLKPILRDIVTRFVKRNIVYITTISSFDKFPKMLIRQKLN